MSHDEMKQAVIGMYSRAASLYGQVGTKQFTYFANLLVNKLSIPIGSRVLDVASGRGALLFASAEKTGISGEVIGIDLAPQMVKETNTEICRRGLTQAKILLMDADETAFCANSFDFVLCGFALHFLDYTTVLPKMLTYLKPGGCFAAIIPYTPRHEEDIAPWMWLFELTKAVFPPDFTPPPAWIAPRLLNRPDLAQAALAQAGFVDVQTETHEAVLFFKDEEDWWDWEWSQGSRFWLEGMSPEGLERFKRESFQHLKTMKGPQGIPMKDGALFVIGHKDPTAT